MRLLSSFVLVRPSAPEKVRASGLVIPDASHAKPEQGTVVESGPGCEVDPGDVVLFSKYTGATIRVGEEDLLMVPYHDIFAVVER
jgi:chaperonin GroES